MSSAAALKTYHMNAILGSLRCHTMMIKNSKDSLQRLYKELKTKTE